MSTDSPMYTEGPAFERVTVNNIIVGGTQVSWEMYRHFTDPGPYVFQLQLGHTGLAAADDWQNVGAPVTNTFFTFDLSQRVWGKTLETHYRVKLTTQNSVYFSNPVSCEGNLSKRDWLKAREIIRKELMRHRVLTSPAGWLLKARRYGPKCTNCVDALTGECSLSNCPFCYGTTFQNGYFTPLSACFADLSAPQQLRDHRNPEKGMDKQYVIQGRFVGDPQLYSYDVWINSTSDERYYINSVTVGAHIRGVPIIYDAELRLAPFSDVIYTFPITNESADQLSQPKEQPWQKPTLNYLEASFRELQRRRTHS